MSEIIRERLNPFIAKLRTKYTEVENGLAAEDPTDDDVIQFRADVYQLNSTIQRAESLMREWQQYIAGMQPDERDAETTLCRNFPPARANPRTEDDPTLILLIERASDLVEQSQSYLVQCDERKRVQNQKPPTQQQPTQPKPAQQPQFNNEPQDDDVDFWATGQPPRNGNFEAGQHNEGHREARQNFSNQFHQNENRRQHVQFDNQDFEWAPPKMAGGTPGSTNATQFSANATQFSTTFRPFKLEPPKFDGNPREWATFWLAFDRAVDSQPIPAYEKHICLLQSLVKDSPARKAVEAYPPSDKNYETVVNILTERFGDTKALREELIAELLHLPMAANSLSSLRSLAEHVERICLQLEAPKTRNSAQDEIVCGIIRSKLPRPVLETLINWEEEAFGDWTLKELRLGLKRIVQRKERLERSINTLRPQEPEPRKTGHQEHQRQRFNQSDNRPRHYQQHRSPQETRVFAATTQPPQPTSPAAEPNPPEPPREQQAPHRSNNQQGCSLCFVGRWHKPSRCNVYKTAEEKRNRLREQKRCFNCLREGHLVYDCPDQRRCSNCGQRHHFVVCTSPPRERRKASPAEHNPNAAPQPNQGRPQPKPRLTGANTEPMGPTRNEQRPTQVTHTTMGITPEQPDESQEDESSQLTAHNEELAPAEESPESEPITAVSIRPPTPGRTILMTRTINVRAAISREPIPAVVFLDPGSQTSYITSSLIAQLGLRKGQTHEMCVHVLGGNEQPLRFRSARYNVQLQRTDGQWERVELSGINQITTRMEIHEWTGNEEEPHLDIPHRVIQMQMNSPDILIGIRQFWDFFISRIPIERGLYLIQTIIGPVIGGHASLSSSPRGSTSLMAINPSNQEQMPTAAAIEDFWNLESIGIKEDPAFDDDVVAERMLVNSIRREPDGRYIVRWPWRNPCPELPSNFPMAFRRLSSTLRRLQENPEQLAKYHQDIIDKIGPGIIEEAQRNTAGREHYLPHHAVITPKKLRIVYDASAHPRGQACLNDCLYRGPVLLPDLAGLLIRFRCCSIPVLADVEKAFLMIGLEPEEREVCKFLWVRDPIKPLTPQNLVIYRFCRVAFGVISAPFVLAGVVRHLLESYGKEQDAVQFWNVYVDNVLMECESKEEAVTKAKIAKQVFNSAQMNLREYVSNSQEVMDTIPMEDRLNQPIAKVLGLSWNTEADDIRFAFPSEEATQPHTRRNVLSLLASIFDPLGLIAPCLLEAKKFFQQLWDTAHGWDESITEKDADKWTSILHQWHNQSLIVPRQSTLGMDAQLQLHIFTDASEQAFATSAYLRSEGMDQVKACLIFSKSRLKPKKAKETLTIPRMELLGLLLGVRAKAFILQQLRRPITSIHVWCDSQIVLARIRAKEAQPVFVENRLREIRQHPDCIFHYVNTVDNPADIASRGSTPEQLTQQRLWWHGPTWLIQSEEAWPNEIRINLQPDPDEAEELPDESPSNEAAFVALNQGEPLIDPAKFSSWLTLLGTIILVLRFIKQRSPSFTFPISIGGGFSAADYSTAKRIIIRLEQQKYTNELRQHRTFVDSDGLLRLQTRIDHNAGPDAPIQPLLLPPHSNVTTLIILDVHKNLKHAGVDWTLTEILGQYWFRQARRTVKKALKKCRRCCLVNSPKYALPPMPPLPSDRVQRRRPFTSIGLDYLGPTVAKMHGQPIKVWIALITCLTTRAVYLEPTTDLSSASLINVLRRFISRRGKPFRILSDNAPHFVLTSKALKALTKADNPGLADFAAQREIHWHFIPQLSPWSGGVYERLVALVKHCLQRTLGRQILPYDELNAFLAEAEASINSRPLTTVSDAEGAPIPLRPVDFLQCGAISHLETNDTDWDPDDRRLPPHQKLAALWKGTQQAIEGYWTRWTKEYLLVLRERSGWTHHGPRRQITAQPTVGDVVLVEEDFRPRNTWPLARIVELNGTPPNVRSVKLRMTNGRELTRPINRLCPLETCPTTAEPNRTLEPVDDPPRPPIEPVTEVVQPTGEGVGPNASNEPKPSTYVVPTNAQKVAEFLASERQGTANQEPTQPSQHGMITRRRTKALGLLGNTLTLCLLIAVSFQSTSAHLTTNCTQCSLRCTDIGVHVKSPPEIQKMEICCMGTCWARPTATSFMFELPRELLINDYECSAHFWHDATCDTFAHIQCPALDECTLIDCTLCWDLITNPSCRPATAMAVIGSSLAIFFSILGFLWSFCLRIHAGAWLFYKICAFVCSGPIRFMNWVTGRTLANPSTKEMEANLKAGVKAAKRGINLVKREARGFQRATVNRIRMPPLIYVCLQLAALFHWAYSGSETIAVVTHSESCKRAQDGLHCTINSATTLTLLPAGQSSTLLLKDEHGIALGMLTLSFKTLQMQCLQRSEAWLRSYRINTLAVKRCPRAGSCRGDHCARVRPNSIVPELREANEYPGNAFCIDSSSFWHNECGLPASACLYYRWYAKPSSYEPFELVSCPLWDVTIHASVLLEGSGGFNQQTEITLHPGMTQRWGNISLTPLAFSIPPVPVLGSKFLTNGRSVAIVDRMPDDLHCADESNARSFNCSLAANACQECAPNHDTGSVTCHCRDLDLEGIIENPAARLPLTLAKVHLRNDGPAIYAQHAYSPIQVHVQMKDLKLILEFRDSKCWVEPIKLSGCYKCPTGAQFQFQCKTDWGDALAKVECLDGTLFAAQCAPNGTEQRIVLPFDHSLVQTRCTVDCPAGETTFNLSAELHYIPLKRQFGHRQRTSERVDPAPEEGWQWPMDFQFDPFAIVRLWANLPLFFIFALSLGLGLLILYFAIKFSPAFRAYRMLMWLFMNQPNRPAGLHTALITFVCLLTPFPAWAERDNFDTSIMWETVNRLMDMIPSLSYAEYDFLITLLAIIAAIWLIIVSLLVLRRLHRRYKRWRRAAHYPPQVEYQMGAMRQLSVTGFSLALLGVTSSTACPVPAPTPGPTMDSQSQSQTSTPVEIIAWTMFGCLLFTTALFWCSRRLQRRKPPLEASMAALALCLLLLSAEATAGNNRTHPQGSDDSENSVLLDDQHQEEEIAAANIRRFDPADTAQPLGSKHPPKADEDAIPKAKFANRTKPFAPVTNTQSSTSSAFLAINNTSAVTVSSLKPAEIAASLKQQVATEKAKHQSTNQQQVDAKQQAFFHDELPDGWVTKRSGRGQLYYYDTHTQRSQWEFPTQWQAAWDRTEEATQPQPAQALTKRPPIFAPSNDTGSNKTNQRQVPTATTKSTVSSNSKAISAAMTKQPPTVPSSSKSAAANTQRTGPSQSTGSSSSKGAAPTGPRLSSSVVVPPATQAAMAKSAHHHSSARRSANNSPARRSTYTRGTTRRRSRSRSPIRRSNSRHRRSSHRNSYDRSAHNERDSPRRSNNNRRSPSPQRRSEQPPHSHHQEDRRQSNPMVAPLVKAHQPTVAPFYTAKVEAKQQCRFITMDKIGIKPLRAAVESTFPGFKGKIAFLDDDQDTIDMHSDSDVICAFNLKQVPKFVLTEQPVVKQEQIEVLVIEDEDGPTENSARPGDCR